MGKGNNETFNLTEEQDLDISHKGHVQEFDEGDDAFWFPLLHPYRLSIPLPAAQADGI